MSGEYRKPVYDLPTVCDVEMISRALHVGEDRVRELVNSGELRRLQYSSRDILVSRDEIFDFLFRSTGHPDGRNRVPYLKLEGDQWRHVPIDCAEEQS